MKKMMMVVGVTITNTYWSPAMDQALHVLSRLIPTRSLWNVIPPLYTGENGRHVVDDLAPGEAAGTLERPAVIQAVWVWLPPPHPLHLHVTLCPISWLPWWRSLHAWGLVPCALPMWSVKSAAMRGGRDYCPRLVPILQMQKPRLIEVKWFAQRPTAGKRRSRSLKQVPLMPNPPLRGARGLWRCPECLFLRLLSSFNIMSSLARGKSVLELEGLWSWLCFLLSKWYQIGGSWGSGR